MTCDNCKFTSDYISDFVTNFGVLKCHKCFMEWWNEFKNGGLLI